MRLKSAYGNASTVRPSVGIKYSRIDTFILILENFTKTAH